MGEWKKTGCVLCAQNCGLEVLVENNRMVKVRPDKDNPRSQGYACRKGLNIAYFQHHDERLTHPLKKVGDNFIKISWDQAVTEIAEKLRFIVGEYGPRSLAFMGLSGLGCQSEAAFGLRLCSGEYGCSREPIMEGRFGRTGWLLLYPEILQPVR
ncbi:molybdopterin-dependent oxidoreductase [Desulfallas sp. Bu1-1]|uniref:molybdopterin-dependent oxidoreductase n=1 Tax=Desulfallas sp. Bu1-1 TaxID=2787620 RepID=UPI001FAC1345|nr:molybdopterin-dependent oxidoreductase [Desulfallas sp. Bu1-1]